MGRLSLRFLGVILLGLLALGGCSAEDAAAPPGSSAGGAPPAGAGGMVTGGSGGGAAACTPGQLRPCTGPGNCSGIETCAADGSGFGACQCTSGTGGATGTGGTGGVTGTGGSGGIVPIGGSGGIVPLGGSGGIVPLGGTGGIVPVGGTGGVPSGGTGGIPLGGTGGIPTGGTGGIPTGGTGGIPTGGTGGGGTGGGGTGGTTWCAPTASAINSSALQTEYDSWKSSYYQDCGDGSACIVDNWRCVSEGVAYGMLAAVNMNDRSVFDALWNYYQSHTNSNGLMHWETRACAEVTGQNGAADAELDAAMALIQADARWGGYTSDATTLITAIRDHETETCSGRIILRPGDAWGGCSDNGQINPSYFAPGYYRVFAQYVPSQASHWNAMVDDTYELYAIYQARMNGLVPDWSAADGGDWYGSGYWYDASRAPWRVATDYAWSCDSRAQTFLQNMSQYVDNNGGISGVPFDKNSAFLGSFALTGMGVSQQKLDGYVSSWLATAHDDAYFQRTLRVVYMLVAAGQFPSTL